MHLILTLLLLSVLVEDMRSRSVTLIQVVLLCIFCVFSNGLLELRQVIMNAVWIGLLFVLASGYAWYAKKLRPFECVGLGDWMFLMALTPLFSFEKYLVIMTLGFVFAMILGIAIRFLQKNSTIPLAGLLALWVSIVINVVPFENKIDGLILNLVA